MGDIEKLVKVVKLMAKTGLYFASCDGDYSQSEKDFLEAYVSGIEAIGSIDDELKQSVYSTFDKTYSLEEIVEDTKEMVDGFEPEQRTAVLKEMQQFIIKVIRLDNKVDSKEEAEFVKWNKALGIG
ncbi:MAG: hypothetical protein IKH26_01310 [Bacteroidaceae bacterium]|nr:hypothetical protein [Bacteroidaceae bacterium]